MAETHYALINKSYDHARTNEMTFLKQALTDDVRDGVCYTATLDNVMSALRAEDLFESRDAVLAAIALLQDKIATRNGQSLGLFGQSYCGHPKFKIFERRLDFFKSAIEDATSEADIRAALEPYEIEPARIMVDDETPDLFEQTRAHLKYEDDYVAQEQALARTESHLNV